jgi:hypothetical protein
LLFQETPVGHALDDFSGLHKLQSRRKSHTIER